MIFDKFKGISEEREIVVQEKNNLETLLEIGDKIVKKYRRRNHDRRNNVHAGIYADLKKKELDFSEQDLISYVMAKSNQDLEKEERLSLGHCTGCLLEILTENNEKQGKRTQLYINGHGNRFDNLFYHAKKIDELIVDSFQGQGICSCIAVHKGKANTLVVLNCKGFGIGEEVGAYGGKIGMILLANNESDNAASGAAYQNGRVELALAVNNKGDSLLINIGSSKGRVNMALASGQQGKLIGFLAGHAGWINKFLIFDCKGDSQGYFFAKDDGFVNLLMVANLDGKGVGAQDDSADYNLKKLVLHNADVSECTRAEKIITGQQAEKEYEKIRQKHATDVLVQLAELISGKSRQEMFDILGKIKDVYQSTKRK